MRLAFVHDWLASYTGAEKALSAMLDLYAEAPIYTLIYQPENFAGTSIAERSIYTSFIERLPRGRRKYQTYLPFMPLAIEQFDLSGYDVVISSSTAVAKAALTKTDQLHISYINTPVRYAWDLYHQYLHESGLDHGLKGWMAKGALHYLRMWDYASAARPDVLIANSHNVARRIKKHYRRDAEVIYPPVDVDRFDHLRPREDFFVTVSRLVPYKRIDVIVDAFTRLGLPLVVIGDGPERARISQLAGPSVRMLGYQSEAVTTDLLERARAFVFAAEEDFGIAPVEAQAAGCPVIAFGKGGALETVVAGQTGLFFHEQSVESLMEAVRQFQRKQQEFDPRSIRVHAEAFSRPRFQAEFSDMVERSWSSFTQGS